METYRALDALGALAQDTRLGIFRLLVEHGPGGLAAGDISRAVGIPGPTLSFHVKALSGAGLVSARQHGRFIRYAADFPTIRGLVDYLTKNCCAAGTGADDCATACAPMPVRQVASIPLAGFPKPSIRPKRRAA